MKPTPLQARVLRLLAEHAAYVTTSRGRAWVEPDRRAWPAWNAPDHKQVRDAYEAAHEAAKLRGLRRASIEACVQAGWLADQQHGPNDWNRGWFITPAGRDLMTMLGAEDFEDRPRPRVDLLPMAVIYGALRDRWVGANGWVWFQEFSPGVNGRRVDALAINRWGGKRGHERMAFEIKRSRGDFLGELREPTKRDEGGSVADRFWFVTPVGMIQPEEVPDDCGLVWVDEDGRVSVKRKAPKREPAPTGRHLLGAILTYIIDRPAQQEWRKAMKDL